MGYQGGTVKARNVQKRMDMAAEECRISLISETEDVAREDQIFIMEHAGSSEMGSRVEGRMRKIKDFYVDKILPKEVRAIIGVFSGENKSQDVIFRSSDGIERKMRFKQGGETKAGTKHALFRHFDTSESPFTIPDISLIFDILQFGQRKEQGRRVEYTYRIEGIKYTIASEKKEGKENFVSFYTNRNGIVRLQNTHSAQAVDNTISDAKIDSNSESSSSDAVNNAKGERFSLRQGL